MTPRNITDIANEAKTLCEAANSAADAVIADNTSENRAAFLTAVSKIKELSSLEAEIAWSIRKLNHETAE